MKRRRTVPQSRRPSDSPVFQEVPEQVLLLNPGFSTADAEYPAFTLEEDSESGEQVVVLRFRDWREQEVRVRFSNAAGVRWEELESPGPEQRSDAVYEVVDSNWLSAYVRSGARTTADQLRHFKLCFNACGTFEVLASGLAVERAG
jgi:hypothetical protein